MTQWLLSAGLRKKYARITIGGTLYSPRSLKTASFNSLQTAEKLSPGIRRPVDRHIGTNVSEKLTTCILKVVRNYDELHA